MRRHARHLLLLGSLLGGPVAFAGQSLESIHPERYRMSASARHEAVIADLDTLLTGPASAASVATAPRSADNGLCVRDVISLDYRHPNNGARGTPFKPFGISNVYQQYHSVGYGAEMSESETQKACRSLDGEKDYWAVSNSPTAADSGLILLKETAIAVRANKAVSFDCKALQDAEIQRRCASEFLAVADQPSSVSHCPQGADEVSRQCFDYILGAYSITITRIWPISGAGGPETAVRVENQEIVVT